MRYLTTLVSIGWILLIMAAAMLLPVITAAYTGDQTTLGVFAGTAVLTAFFGGASLFAGRGRLKEPARREALILPVLAWVVTPVFAAPPFILTGSVDTLAQAYFEAVSGFTTTGATVIGNLSEVPSAILLWRALLQWLGGFATLAMAISFFVVLNIGGMSLFNNRLPHGEGDRLTDRVRGVVLSLWWIYLLISGLCLLLLWLVGTPTFEALCLTFSTISTGGFMPREGTLADYGNPAIPIILMPFMLIGAINFTLHWAALEGRLKAYRRDPELRTMWIIVLIATALFTTGLLTGLGQGKGSEAWNEGLMDGLFAAISTVSTTGYISAREMSFPLTPALVILPLLVIGGCSGSTTGGLKIMRLRILLKYGAREMARLSHPHGVVPQDYGTRGLSDDLMSAVWAFFILYVLLICFSTLALSLLGLDLQAAISAVTT
ncbi:MAG: potassium transporter TrkG, partial [Alphaproteobacteria bacterium]|nr:potassium transporter TrkG [Alphaproteobacteria bacterium]